MTRLKVYVEGQTEKNFVDEILLPHLVDRLGYEYVSASFLGDRGDRRNEGGILPWEGRGKKVRPDILTSLKQDPEVIVTTMVDYYRLIKWPGLTDARSGQKSSCERASIIEKALSDDISSALPNLDPRRFVPYVVMHEFEGLLFSDPDRFAQSIGQPELSGKFRAIRDEFPTPEDIDDSPETHPSQQICALFPRYQKRLMGVDAAREIGLDVIRNECPVFGRWLEKLECLV